MADRAAIHKVCEIFERLKLKQSDIVFFHTSSDQFASLFSLSDFFKAVEQYFDPKATVCMPSYPFNDRTYDAYMSSSTTFSVRHTPARICLASEVFRRHGETVRSLHPWASVAARGKHAMEIVKNHSSSVRVFGEASPFGKIVELGGKVVGIGLDCNTNSFAHIPDYELLQYSNVSEYRDYYYVKSFRCINQAGKEITIESDVVNPLIRKRIKPRKLIPLLNKFPLYNEWSEKNINFYALELQPFITLAVESNLGRVKNNEWPSYYE